MNIKNRLELARYLFVLMAYLCSIVAVLSPDEGYVSVILALVGLLFGALSLVAKRMNSSVVV